MCSKEVIIAKRIYSEALAIDALKNRSETFMKKFPSIEIAFDENVAFFVYVCEHLFHAKRRSTAREYNCTWWFWGTVSPEIGERQNAVRKNPVEVM